MTVLDTVSAPAQPPRDVEWSAIFAGAIIATALSFLLLTFGSAIGLSLTSPWPNSGAKLWVVGLAVLWWTVAVQIGSFAAGGYLAGRMRTRSLEGTTDETRFRDSAHGLLVWAVGTLIGAALLALVGTGTAKVGAQAASAAAVASSQSAVSPADAATDVLLRRSGPNAGRTQGNAAADPELREQIKRVFATTIRNGEVSQRDYDYLVREVAARNGIPETEARARVEEATTEAKNIEVNARAAADKARKAGIVAAFTAAASLLISLVVACLAAAAGGRHRDQNVMPLFSGHRFW